MNVTLAIIVMAFICYWFGYVCGYGEGRKMGIIIDKMERKKMSEDMNDEPEFRCDKCGCTDPCECIVGENTDREWELLEHFEGHRSKS